MTFCSFFKSRATKYGSMVGSVVFAAGAGGSAALSLKFAALCSSLVSSLQENIGTTVSIAELSGVIDIDKFKTNFTIYNVTAPYPASWLEAINSTEELPAYCFSVPLTVGLCITTAISLSLASAVMTAIHIHDQRNEHPRNNDNSTVPVPAPVIIEVETDNPSAPLVNDNDDGTAPVVIAM